MTDYPPAPWDLAGTGHLSTWRVPLADLPALPNGVHAMSVRGTASVTTAFVDYSPAGLMAYRELLAAVLVRHGRRPALCITDIWVDNAVSLAGGRALWGIPKDLARFTGLAAQLPSGTAGGPIASAHFRPRRVPSLPLPLALPGSVVQTRDGETTATPIRASGRLRAARARWRFDPEGPLAWLGRARPVASVVAEDFALRFGT